jgi:hypothetical protein
MLFLDGVRVGGVYGTKEAAFEAAMVAASFAVRDGDGVQVSVPSDARLSEEWVEKPAESTLTIPAHLHDPVTQLPPEQRRDRRTVNEAIRLADPDA